MTRDTNLSELTIAGLAHRCAEETERFFRRLDHDPRYCFELFRRAILDNDQRAWEVVYAQYRSLLAGWVQRHPAFDGAGEETEYFVTGAFEKLRVSLAPDRFDRFLDLPSVLRYLQTCVHSVVLDHVRVMERARLEVSFEALAREPVEPGPATEDQAFSQVESKALWNWLDMHLKDDRERLVLHDSFVLALKPNEILRQHRDAFDDVSEIYRIKQNVLARLGRNAEFRELFGMDA